MRKKSKRVTALRAEDAKIQAERRARIAAAQHKRHHQMRPKSVPKASTTKSSPQTVPHISITRSRGAYANDFSGRRAPQPLRSAGNI